MTTPTMRELVIARRSLGVNCQATKTQIRQAFKARALILHPDMRMVSKRHPAKDIRRSFATLVAAYQLLRRYVSPVQKNRYNGYLKKARLGYALARLEDLNHKFEWER